MSISHLPIGIIIHVLFQTGDIAALTRQLGGQLFVFVSKHRNVAASKLLDCSDWFDLEINFVDTDGMVLFCYRPSSYI